MQKFAAARRFSFSVELFVRFVYIETQIECYCGNRAEMLSVLNGRPERAEVERECVVGLLKGCMQGCFPLGLQFSSSLKGPDFLSAFFYFPLPTNPAWDGQPFGQDGPEPDGTAFS